MTVVEYLVRHGRFGDFGRFRAEPAIPCERGQRVVIRTYRGLELGEVLHEATEGHAPFLPNTTVGALVRHANPDDESHESELTTRSQQLLLRAGELNQALALPVEFLDAEILLDGRRAVLHHLSAGSCDPRNLVSTLAREFDLLIELINLSDLPPEVEPDTFDDLEESGCGSCGSGGTCGTGDGCGSCGSKKATRERYSRLREEMEQHRTPLL